MRRTHRFPAGTNGNGSNVQTAVASPCDSGQRSNRSLRRAVKNYSRPCLRCVFWVNADSRSVSKRALDGNLDGLAYLRSSQRRGSKSSEARSTAVPGAPAGKRRKIACDAPSTRLFSSGSVSTCTVPSGAGHFGDCNILRCAKSCQAAET